MVYIQLAMYLRLLGAVRIGSCEVSETSAVNRMPVFLQEQDVLLTAEPSLLSSVDF